MRKPVCVSCRHEWLPVTLQVLAILAGNLVVTFVLMAFLESLGAWLRWIFDALIFMALFLAGLMLAKRYLWMSCSIRWCPCGCHAVMTCPGGCHYWCDPDKDFTFLDLEGASVRSGGCAGCDHLHREDKFRIEQYDNVSYNCVCACHREPKGPGVGRCSCHRWCRGAVPGGEVAL